MSNTLWASPADAPSVVMEMNLVLSMKVGTEGVGGGVVVVDADELREVTGAGEGAAVPTDVTMYGFNRWIVDSSSSSCLRLCTSLFEELGVG
jgi:hypothetical protein